MNTKTPSKKVTQKRPDPVTHDDVSRLRMVAGNEKKFTKVIHNGEVKEWVGFAWFYERKATRADYLKIPEVRG